MTELIFPHPILTPLATNEEPTAATLRVLHKQINENAIAIPSSRGNGLLGHFILVVDDAVYTTRAGNDAANNPITFDLPTNPGPSAVHLAGASAEAIAEANRVHAIRSKEFTIFVNTEAALKKQVIAAVPETYYSILGDDIIGYADVTVLEILAHLDDTYGALTEDDLDRNIKLMNSPWNTQDPIETLFDRLKSCRTFAAATEPIEEATMIRAGLQIIEATSQFAIPCQEWRDKPRADKTMKKFMIHFAKANVNRKRTLTSSAAGYQRAAQVSGTPTKATGIANLDIGVDTANSVAKHDGKTTVPMFYCWTHGLTNNAAHTSKTCNNRHELHNVNSTANDMKGGNDRIQRQRNEKQIYVRPERKPKPPPST